MKVGYARVSTVDQNLRRQVDALKKAGCKKIVREKESADKTRPKLKEMLGWLRKKDTLICTRMDRLARSLKELIKTLSLLNEKSVNVVFLDQKLNTSSAGGRLIFHVFAAVAEFEHDLIRERTLEGLKAARVRGRLGGRRRILKGAKLKAAFDMYDSNEYPVSQICETLEIKERTFYEYLKRRRRGELDLKEKR
jgi:DNA invertase Pin-like site-specific DNA recombinase